MEFKGNLKKTKIILKAVSNPEISNSNEANIVLDSSDMKLKVSVNGGNYTELGGGGSELKWYSTTDGFHPVSYLGDSISTDRRPLFTLMYTYGNLNAKLIRIGLNFYNTISSVLTVYIGVYTGISSFSIVGGASKTFSVTTYNTCYYLNLYSNNISNNMISFDAGNVYMIGIAVNGFSSVEVVGKVVVGVGGYDLVKLSGTNTTTCFASPLHGARYYTTHSSIPSYFNINQLISTKYGGYTIPYILFSSIDPETGSEL